MMNWKNDSNTPIIKQEKVSYPKHSFTDLPTILRILFIDIALFPNQNMEGVSKLQ